MPPKQRARRAFTLIEIIIVVLILGIVFAITVPNFARAREAARAKACMANLKQIDIAKAQYAMDHKIPASSTRAITVSNLVPAYIKARPTCPSGGTYTYGSRAARPLCATNGGGTVGQYNYHGL